MLTNGRAACQPCFSEPMLHPFLPLQEMNWRSDLGFVSLFVFTGSCPRMFPIHLNVSESEYLILAASFVGDNLTEMNLFCEYIVAYTFFFSSPYKSTRICSPGSAMLDTQASEPLYKLAAECFFQKKIGVV